MIRNRGATRCTLYQSSALAAAFLSEMKYWTLG